MRDVSACIATRGDVDMTGILAEIEKAGIEDVILWDNSVLPDFGPHGRFRAIKAAMHPVIYVQDDDVLVPAGSIRQLIAAYTPGAVVANMPPEFRTHYPDSALVGFGAVFDRDLPAAAFERFLDYHDLTEDDLLFRRESCRVFTTLTPRVLLDVPKTDLAWYDAPNRLWKQPDHVALRDRALTLARQVRDAT